MSSELCREPGGDLAPCRSLPILSGPRRRLLDCFLETELRIFAASGLGLTGAWAVDSAARVHPPVPSNLR
jgi:hypothetical protein